MDQDVVVLVLWGGTQGCGWPRSQRMWQCQLPAVHTSTHQGQEPACTLLLKAVQAAFNFL